ncbi:hypothetical protein GJAV_G00143640 [Gymnothorax javanicus]|nr:hypothetical protein GJAV_G00143640 [Gymnothorax javanicus]
MDVAELDEAQSKKIFRARKTMKISDRQQLGSIHNSNSSTVPTSTATGTPSAKTTPPAVMNGKCSEAEERTERESDTDKTPKGSRPASPVSRTPSPLTLSLSLSPSPPSQSPKPGSESSARQSPPRSPHNTGKVRDKEESDNSREKEKEKPSSEEMVETAEEKKTEGGEREGKEDGDGSEVKDKEVCWNEKPKPDGDGSPTPNSTSPPASPSASEKKDKEESTTEMKKGAESEEATAMETDLAPTEVKALDGEEMAPLRPKQQPPPPRPSPRPTRRSPTWK